MISLWWCGALFEGVPGDCEPAKDRDGVGDLIAHGTYTCDGLEGRGTDEREEAEEHVQDEDEADDARWRFGLGVDFVEEA